ncbi:MAG TPA: methyl-accepting chemotaxis protein, partial [Lachnospiraceae bacterium]|nr:methyl-accepting chemotaxis protein [Lachnospiraceae bacterium]
GMSEGVDTILSAADVCDESKVVIVDAMGALSSISEQNAAASEQTSASMDEFTATIGSVTNTAESLKKIADELSTEMEFFKV